MTKTEWEIGDVMPAGHKQAGWIYMGPDDETGEDFYAAPQDEPGTYSFNRAGQRAETVGAKMPSRSQLDKMNRYKDKGALKSTFNETGLNPAGRYWTSEEDFVGNNAWAQRFIDGYPYWDDMESDASLRCVR